jgi:membrane-associated HD superfamily phosphohydrolase
MRITVLDEERDLDSVYIYIYIYMYMRVRKRRKKKRRHFENRHYIIFIYIFIYKFGSCKSKVIYLKAKKKSQITSECNQRIMKIIINRLNTSVCQLIIFYFLFTLMCSCFSSVNSFIHYHLARNDHHSLSTKK